MKHTQNIFLLALTAISFFGCRKDHPTTHTVVQGQVLEYGSNHPLANMQVIVGVKSNSAPGGNYSTQAVLNSDANGNFHYEFDGIEGDIYVIGMNNLYPYYSAEFSSSVAGYPSFSSNSQIGLTVGQTNTISVVLVPPGFLKLHTKNIHNNHGFNLAMNNQSLYFELADTTHVYGMQGSTYAHIQWSIIDSLNNSTNHLDSIFVPAFDTISYQILY